MNRNVLAGVVTLALSTLLPVSAQDKPTHEVYGNSAHVFVSGDRIALRQLPIKNLETGDVTYRDIVIALLPRADGTVGATLASSIDVSQRPHPARELRPGRYVDKFGNTFELNSPASSMNGSLNYSMIQTGEAESGRVSGLTISVSSTPVAKRYPNWRTVSQNLELYHQAEVDGYLFGKLSYEDAAYETPSRHLLNNQLCALSMAGYDVLELSCWSAGQKTEGVLLKRQ